MRFVLAAFAGLCLLAAPARADTLTTFDFEGSCSQCSGTATAELVLTNYALGNAIDYSNFVSFHYDGVTIEPEFTITSSDAPVLSGSMRGPFPAMEDFSINGNSELFTTLSDGSWCVGGGCQDEFGDSRHLWLLSADTTGVPEPLGLTLLTTPCLAAIMLRRRTAHVRGQGRCDPGS